MYLVFSSKFNDVGKFVRLINNSSPKSVVLAKYKVSLLYSHVRFVSNRGFLFSVIFTVLYKNNRASHRNILHHCPQSQFIEFGNQRIKLNAANCEITIYRVSTHCICARNEILYGRQHVFSKFITNFFTYCLNIIFKFNHVRFSDFLMTINYKQRGPNCTQQKSTGVILGCRAKFFV